MASKEADKKGDGDAPPPAEPVPWYRQLLSMKDTLIIVLTPFIFLPIVIMYDSPAARCAYSVLIIAVYWMTECLPMAVTSILPVVLMTWLGVIDSRVLCRSYLQDANFLFLGGLMFAIAVERWGLHKRVALRVLLLVGSRPVWIMFGNMAVIGFLSMWLANIATCAMMIPIAAAVLDELNAHRLQRREEEKQKRMGMEMKPLNGDQKGIEAAQGEQADTAAGVDATVVVLDGSQKRKDETAPLKEMDESQWTAQYAKEDDEFRLFACALKISVSYAASIGGTGTLIGSGPNIVLKGQAETKYGSDTGIDFFSFFIFSFPHMIIILLLCWLSLVLIFIGPKKAFGKQQAGEDAHSAAAVLRREYEKLGPMTWPELWVMGLFLTLALLWITKQPQFVPGWADLMPNNYVTDSVVAVTVCMFLFIVPARKPNYLCLWNRSDPNPPGPAPSLLDWKTVHRDMQWGVILLLGGGFAIADACKASGLSASIASFLKTFETLDPPLIVFLVSSMAVFCTTFTSNVATATLLIPIACDLANGIEMHPVYLIFPVALAVNFSFILPVSTPGNAIVFAYGDITVPDMMKVGFVNTFIDIAVLQLAINTWGYAYFDFSHFPLWAEVARNRTLLANATAACNTP